MNVGIETHKIVFSSGEESTYITRGTGPIALLMTGPASFYLPKFSDELMTHITLVAFDDSWTCHKGEITPPEVIAKVTSDSITAKLGELTLHLRKRFDRVGFLGISVMAAQAMQSSISLEDAQKPDFFVGIGVPLMPLDSGFAATDEVFEVCASPRRKEDALESKELFTALTEGKRLEERLPRSNVTEGRLSPTSFFTEMSRSMGSKARFDLTQADEFGEAWRASIALKINNEAMRIHFFSKILPLLGNTPDLLKQLNDQRIPCTIYFGDRDFITPYRKLNAGGEIEDLSKPLDALFHITTMRIENCGHEPMLEKPEIFDEHLVRTVQSWFVAEEKSPSLG